jgi:hypothetical protein
LQQAQLRVESGFANELSIEADDAVAGQLIATVVKLAGTVDANLV